MFNLKYTTRMLYHIMPQSQPLKLYFKYILVINFKDEGVLAKSLCIHVKAYA